MEMASETTQNSALRTDEAASHGPLWRLIDCAVILTDKIAVIL